MKKVIGLALVLTACGVDAAGTSAVNPGVAPPAAAPPPPPVNQGVAPPPAAPTVTPGEPFVAPERTWTWVDVAGTKCADGTPTGVGVNLSKTSNDVLIFFEGGGACWDGASCWGPVQTAFYVATGYGKAEFDLDPQIAAMYVLNRGDASNPFKDANIVYVPYCTGDSYAGDNTVPLEYLGITHLTQFKGYYNFGLTLARIVGTFPNASRLWVAGDSAGGFGAAFNFGRVQDAFPKARVDVLDDSGQPIAPDPAQWKLWQKAWNMQLPADCADCASSPSGFVDYFHAKYPNSRYGLISYEYDTIIAPFMGISLDQFHTELYAMADHVDQTWPNARYFVIPGASHVGLATPSAQLKDWVTRMVTDSPSWGSTRP